MIDFPLVSTMTFCVFMKNFFPYIMEIQLTSKSLLGNKDSSDQLLHLVQCMEPDKTGMQNPSQPATS